MRSIGPRYEMAVRERDEIMPLRKSIAEQDLLRYDAAQISVFDLLADARDRNRGVNDYIQSVRDFWIAKSDARYGADRQSGALGQEDLWSPDDIFQQRRVPPLRPPRSARRRSPRCRRSLPAIRPTCGRRLQPPNGRPYQPVATLNGWTLPWRMRNGVKEFHLVAEAGDSRDRAGHAGASLGLQRSVAGADDRSRGGRSRAHVRDQPPAPRRPAFTGTVSACPTVWTASRGSINRRSNPDRPSSTNSPRSERARSCITRTPTKRRKWPWA